MQKLFKLLSRIPSRLFQILGPVLILSLALFRTLPALLLDNPAQFFNKPGLKIAQYTLWVLIILVCLLCELSLHISQNPKDWIRCRNFHLGTLLVAYILMVFFAHGWVNEVTTSSWNTCYVEPDTKSYILPYNIKSVRTPLYPLFSQVASSGAAASIRVNDLPFNQPLTSGVLPLLQIVQSQKLILLTSALVLAMTMVYLLHSILPIPLVLLFLDFDFFTTYKAYVLSEALAQALLILLAACLLAYLYKAWRWLLPFSALLVAMLILTRPSNAYGLILFAAILLWALLKDFKRSRFYILASILISAVLVFGYICASQKRFLLGQICQNRVPESKSFSGDFI